MNIADIDTGPQYKFRAVHNDGRIGQVGEIYLYDITKSAGVNRPCITVTVKLTGKTNDGLTLYTFEQWESPDCHIDLFTGHIDKDNQEVYGGDVWMEKLYGAVRIIEWCKLQTSWFLTNPESGKRESLCRFNIKEGRIIGNIHNLDALPEEVREMIALEKEVKNTVKAADKLNRELDEAGRLDPRKLDEQIKEGGN